jgi:DHA3 family tetracycline resistance protein-like MFS transporter
MSVGWPAARVYYSLVVASAFSPFTVLAVYFVRVVHMSPLELVLTGTVMEATIFVFEVPTGAFADTFGRKRSVVFAYLLEGAAIVVVGLVPSFPAIAAAWALWGFGYTFESGSKEAWLADEVGPDRFGGVLMRASRIGSAASILGLLAGVAIALASLRAAVVFGGAVTILGTRARTRDRRRGALRAGPPGDRAPRRGGAGHGRVEGGVRPALGGALHPRRRPAGGRVA